MSEKKENRTRIVGLRFSETEYKKILDLSSSTTTPQISEYIRRIIFNKQITVKSRNQSLDEFMAEMILLRNELKAIGNNFNQAVRKLNILNDEAEVKNWHLSYQSYNDILLNKIEEIKQRINQISDSWLQ